MMTIDPKTGLVLEGGGLRGVFTCGVLDYFLDVGQTFPYVIGVSAGACNGLSFMSGQRGRAKCTNIDMMEKYRYIGVRSLLKGRGFIDMDLLFDDFPEKILPYDYAAYFRNPAYFEMVTTNCLTGKPCYLHEDADGLRLTRIARISSSLPYVCPMVKMDGVPMLDGGIVDSIPLQRAMDMGYERNVVVLTRNKGFRRSEDGLKLPWFIYRKYPQLRAALMDRGRSYNRQLEMVERLEEEGRIVVVRPERPIVVGRLENDVKKLRDLYEEGYEVARRMFGGKRP